MAIKRGRRIMPSLIKILFVLIVIVPTGAALFYALTTKSHLYVSSTDFAVEDRQQSGGNVLGGLASAVGIVSGEPGAIHSVKRFLESGDALKSLEEQYGFSKYYQSPHGDILTQLPADASSDVLLKYYRRHVSAQVSSKENIITLEVSSFDPEVSQKIASTLLILTETFVNDLNARALDDQVRFQERAVSQAHDKVLQARMALTEWRNENGAIDPTAQVQLFQGLIGTLETELTSVQADLALLLESDSPDRFRPRIETLQDRERVILRQISSARDRLASSSSSSTSMKIDEYQRLSSDLEFATKELELAVTSFETARQVILQQQKYIIAITTPTLPSDANFPRANYHVPVVFLTALLLFALVTLLVHVLRDYRRV